MNNYAKLYLKPKVNELNILEKISFMIVCCSPFNSLNTETVMDFIKGGKEVGDDTEIYEMFFKLYLEKMKKVMVRIAEDEQKSFSQCLD